MPDNSSSNPLDSTTTLKLTLPPIEDRRILAVIVKLQSDLSRHFTPEELAKVANLSASYMQARFSELVKKPLEKFQQEVRVKAAHDLFVTEFLTVQEVMKKIAILAMCLTLTSLFVFFVSQANNKAKGPVARASTLTPNQSATPYPYVKRNNLWPQL